MDGGAASFVAWPSLVCGHGRCVLFFPTATVPPLSVLVPRPGTHLVARGIIMTASTSPSRSLTDASLSTSSSQSTQPLSGSVSRSPKMKDVSNSLRPPRPTAYPKKRPSPHGVSKSRKQSPLCPAQAVVRKSPRAAKADVLLQRQREAHILAMRRDGIFLEEEYRDEIRLYMHDMEVRSRRRPLSIECRY